MIPTDLSPDAIAREEAALMQQMAAGDYGIEEPAPFGPPQIFDCEQLSFEWFTIRRGVPTASNFDRIFTAKTRRPSASQADYIAELIAEKASPFIPFSTDRPMTREMQDGVDREPEARHWYSLQTDAEVRRVGFMLTSDGRFGCSPDGLVGEDGALELKCPLLKTQVKYLQDGTLPLEYAAQVHGQLIVTGRKWVDFVSYAFPLAPLLVRVVPDEYTRLLRESLEAFWARYQYVAKRIAAL